MSQKAALKRKSFAGAGDANNAISPKKTKLVQKPTNQTPAKANQQPNKLNKNKNLNSSTNNASGQPKMKKFAGVKTDKKTNTNQEQKTRKKLDIQSLVKEKGPDDIVKNFDLKIKEIQSRPELSKTAQKKLKRYQKLRSIALKASGQEVEEPSEKPVQRQKPAQNKVQSKQQQKQPQNKVQPKQQQKKPQNGTQQKLKPQPQQVVEDDDEEDEEEDDEEDGEEESGEEVEGEEDDEEEGEDDDNEEDEDDDEDEDEDEDDDDDESEEEVVVAAPKPQPKGKPGKILKKPAFNQNQAKGKKNKNK